MAKKSKKAPTYDLKSADRKRNLLVQVGLTSVVVVFAVALVLWIVLGSDRGQAGEGLAIRVASPEVLTGQDGQPQAVLQISEDLLCPACAGFEQQYGETIDRLIDSGAVAVDYHMVAILDRPQNQNYSSRAGAAAYCVADEDTEAFRRFHSTLYSPSVQPSEVGGTYPDNAALIELARQAGAAGSVPECIESEQYVETVQGMAADVEITATPTIRINGEDWQRTAASTPDDLVAAVTAIVGDVPGLQAPAGPTAP